MLPLFLEVADKMETPAFVTVQVVDVKQVAFVSIVLHTTA